MTKHRSPSGRKRPFETLAFLLLLAVVPGCSGAAEEPPAGGTPAQAAAAPDGKQQPATPETQPGREAAAKPVDPTPLDTAKLPDVVARVNGQAIPKADLLNASSQMKQQMAMSGAPKQDDTVGFYREVLDGLIARALLYQEAKAEGVMATDEEVKKQLEGLHKRFPDEKKFAEALAAQGMSEAKLAEQAKQTISVEKLVTTKIMPAVTVDDAAAKAFYDQNQDKMKQPEKLRLRHILIRTDPKATEADKQKARAEADGVLARVKKGEDFAALAKQYSADPGSKEKGGELPPLGRGETVPPFEQAAFALKDNEVSGVVESPFGYHIIQRLGSVPESVAPFDEVKPRILQFLRQQKLQQEVRSRVDALKAKAKVEVLI